MSGRVEVPLVVGLCLATAMTSAFSLVAIFGVATRWSMCAGGGAAYRSRLLSDRTARVPQINT